MSYNVFTILPFDRQLKRLVKKYPSLKTEYAQLVKSLEADPAQGVAMANNQLLAAICNRYLLTGNL